MSMNENPRRGTLVELAESECLILLSTTTVGRVAFVNDDGQQLVPLNFAVINGVIYFRTKPDGLLAQLASGHHDVAFGVDHHDDTYRDGWNVTVKGKASLVEDRSTINTVLSHGRLRPWAGGARPLVIRVSIDSIAGRRVSGH